MSTKFKVLGDASITIDLAAIESDLRPKSSGDLKKMFVESVGRASEFIARAAIIIKLLDERGEHIDIPATSKGIYRKIAEGQVLPELFFLFSSSPVCRAVTNLPLPDQRRLVNNPRQVVAQPAPGGGYTQRMVDITTAPAEIANRVIGPEGIRSAEEQIAYMEASNAAKKKYQKPQEAVEQTEPDEPLNRSVTVKMTTSELTALTVNAAHKGITPAVYARRALLQAKAFDETRR